MANVMTPYIVRQGDFLAKLAFVKGFDADTVWNDPKNDDLRKVRPDPNILAPGDILYIPSTPKPKLAIDQGTANAYSATIPTTNVKLTFCDDKGPLENQAYEVRGLGDVVKGTTDGDGSLTAAVPIHTREVQIYFTTLKILHPVFVGDIDPITEASGVRQRLDNLGFTTRGGVDPPPAPSAAEQGELDIEALLAFQRCFGLDPSGVVDDATRAELLKRHRS